MQHITGIARLQMRLSGLEDTIDLENQVRFIDAFVAVLNLSEIGFEVKTIKKEGRPSYNIKRSINILGIPELIAKLQNWNSPYKAKHVFCSKLTSKHRFTAHIFWQQNNAA